MPMTEGTQSEGAESPRPHDSSEVAAPQRPKTDSSTEVTPKSVAPGAFQAAVRDLEISCAIAALLTLALLLLATLGAVVPSSSFSVTLSAQATPLAPPPWNTAYGSSAPGAGMDSLALITVVAIAALAVAAWAFAYSGYRELRRSVGALPDLSLRQIRNSAYLMAGAGVATILYFVLPFVAIAILLNPPSPPPPTPAAFIASAQGTFASLGGLLAVFFFTTIVLVALFHRTLRRVLAQRAVPRRTESAWALLVVGAGFSFAIVATPYLGSSPFSTTLYLLGGASPEFSLATVPGWLFLSAAFGLLALDYRRIESRGEAALATSVRSPTAAALPEGAGIVGAPPARVLHRGAVRRTSGVVLIAMGVTLAIYSAPSLGTAYGELAHLACVPEGMVVNETLWTPTLVINSPYGGFASGSWTTIDPSGTGWGTWTTYAKNGTTNVFAAATPWLVYHARSELVPGAGSDAPCAGPFVAETTGLGLSSEDYLLYPPSNYSDRGLPQQFGGANTSVIFSAGYSGIAASESSNCPNGAPLVWTAQSEFFRIQVPFEYGGVFELADASVNALVNYTYTASLPGTYYVEDLAALSSGYGSGLAFDYVPC